MSIIYSLMWQSPILTNHLLASPRNPLFIFYYFNRFLIYTNSMQVHHFHWWQYPSNKKNSLWILYPAKTVSSLNINFYLSNLTISTYSSFPSPSIPDWRLVWWIWCLCKFLFFLNFSFPTRIGSILYIYSASYISLFS